MTIIWSITDRNGAALPLTDKEVHLYYTCERGRFEADIEIQDGNVVIWHFFAKDQRVLGDYKLTLTILQSAGKRAIRRDICTAFTLVGRACEENYGDDEANINEGGEITLASELDIYRISPIIPTIGANGNWRVDGVDTGLPSRGRSAYEYAVSQGYIGTEDEFAEELKKATEQPDWNASEGDGGYIANKPFGEIYNKLEWYYDDSADGVVCDTVVDKVFIDGKEYDLTLGEILNIDNTNFGVGIDEYHGKIKVYGAREDDVDWVTNNVLTGGVIKTIDERYIPNTIARTNGYYQSVTVGYSDNLVGRGESTPEMFSFRASGGRSINDGAARIKTLRGNSVVWNQLFDYIGLFGNSASVTTDDNSIIVTATNSAFINAYKFFAFKTNHKYAFSCVATLPFSDVVVMGTTEYGNAQYRQSVVANTPTAVVGIVECTKAESIFYIFPNWNVAASVGDEFRFSNVRIIDLTKMFGDGNEPTSIEEFNARMPLGVDMNAYNEGEVIPFNGTAIKSVGDNAWDEEWENGTFDTTSGVNISNNQIRSKDYIKVLPNTEYYITQPAELMYDGMWIILYDSDKKVIEGYIGSAEPNGNSFKVAANTNGHFKTAPNARYMRFYMPSGYGSVYKNDIAISLYHSGWKAENAKYQPYKEFIRNIDTRILEMFPDGMNKWDKVYNKNGRGYVIKGTGKVDMGTLSYAYQPPIAGSFPLGFFYVDIANKAHGNINMLSGKYDTTADWVNVGIRGDESAKTIYVKDGAFANAASFKAAMQGVMLYYELAEPQVYEFAEPFNLDYEVADFGTEEVIASKPSAPISADIIYQFNAVDSIRDLLARIAVLESKVK